MANVTCFCDEPFTRRPWHSFDFVGFEQQQRVERLSKFHVVGFGMAMDGHDRAARPRGQEADGRHLHALGQADVVSASVETMSPSRAMPTTSTLGGAFYP